MELLLYRLLSLNNDGHHGTPEYVPGRPRGRGVEEAIDLEPQTPSFET